MYFTMSAVKEGLKIGIFFSTYFVVLSTGTCSRRQLNYSDLKSDEFDVQVTVPRDKFL
jgi:hypothetical protein